MYLKELYGNDDTFVGGSLGCPPGHCCTVAKQFLRCTLHQLAPNGIFPQLFLSKIEGEFIVMIRGAFHQAFCQWFSLTNFISYWNPCIWLAESKFVSEKHWQNAWWNAPPPLANVKASGFHKRGHLFKSLLWQFCPWARNIVFITQSIGENLKTVGTMIA